MANSTAEFLKFASKTFVGTAIYLVQLVKIGSFSPHDAHGWRLLLDLVLHACCQVAGVGLLVGIDADKNPQLHSRIPPVSIAPVPGR